MDTPTKIEPLELVQTEYGPLHPRFTCPVCDEDWDAIEEENENQ